MKIVASLAAVVASASAAYAVDFKPYAATRAAPEGTTAIAVFTPRGTAGDRLNVCLYPGGQPRDYLLLSVSCRDGADRCTAFVALPNDEAEVILPTYDLAQPPIAADGGSCEGLPFRPTGVLSPRAN